MSDTATLEPTKAPETAPDEDVSFLDEFVSGRTAKSTDEKPAKKTDKKDDEPPAQTTTDAAAPKEEAPAKAKKTKATVASPPIQQPPQQPLPPPVDYEKIAEASGRGAAAALSKATEKKATEVTDAMTDDERDQYAVIQRMGKDFPKFAGKAKEYAESIQRAAKYQQEWETNNPGKAFNPEDGNHDDFYEKNDVTLDDHYYARTMARIEAEQLLAKQDSKDSKRLSELEAKEKVRDAEPLIAAAAAHARQSFYGMAGEEFAKVVDANGNVDHAELKRIVEADPAKSVIVNAANSVPAFAADLHKLTNGLEEFANEEIYRNQWGIANPGRVFSPKSEEHEAFYKKLSKHNYIADFAERQQQTVYGMSPAEQADLAKKLNRTDAAGAFVTAEEYNAIPPAQRNRYWRLTETDLSLLYAAEQAALAKQSVADEETKWEAAAKARGYQKVNGAATPASENTAPLESPRETRPPLNSPAATIAPMNAHAAGDKSVPQKNATDSFLADFLR